MRADTKFIDSVLQLSPVTNISHFGKINPLEENGTVVLVIIVVVVFIFVFFLSNSFDLNK